MRKIRFVKDRLFRSVIFGMSVFTWVLLLAIFLGLLWKSRSILALKPLGELLTSSAWAPSQGNFGFLPFILGTVWVTLIAIAIAAPFCVLTGIYLSEYAHTRFREFFRPIIDLLAGIPSVIYGLWGVLLIVPFIKKHLAPWCGFTTTGYTVLAGGIVLAVMIAPVIINITMEVLRSIPRETREASLSLGATKWQAVKTVAFRRGLTGILAGVVLAISRAFGETMAVLMVAGNVPAIPRTLFDAGYPLPALIANSYGEMLTIPQFESALMFASLILMVIVFIFNILSRFILIKIEERI